MHDDYKQLDLSQFASAPPNGRVLDPCPLCNSPAQLWQYSESETTPRKLLVMCSHGDRIGPQDGITNEGCPFYMPPNGHYRETIRDAVRYWNELARAIVALRTAGVAGTPAGSALDAAFAESIKVGEALEAKAREIYDGWKELPGWVPWVECGNSSRQDEARREAADGVAMDVEGADHA